LPALIRLETFQYRVADGVLVRVRLLFIVGDHQLLGLAAKVRQGVVDARDTFSSAQVDMADRVCRQAFPDPSVARHVKQWDAIEAIVQVAKHQHKESKGKIMSKTEETRLINEVLRVAIGNVKDEPLFAKDCNEAGLLDQLELRFYLPPSMHNQNKIGEASLHVINWYTVCSPHDCASRV
jgi:hypothetical protein